MLDHIDDSNFVLFAAKCYDNPSCQSIEEFHQDLKKFKYLNRLFGKYKSGQELKINLIINHLNLIYNVFGDQATKMLFFKLKDYLPYLIPFLILIGRSPRTININGSEIIISDIPLDQNIIDELRKL